VSQSPTTRTLDALAFTSLWVAAAAGVLAAAASRAMASATGTSALRVPYGWLACPGIPGADKRFQNGPFSATVTGSIGPDRVGMWGIAISVSRYSQATAAG